MITFICVSQLMNVTCGFMAGLTGTDWGPLSAHGPQRHCVTCPSSWATWTSVTRLMSCLHPHSGPQRTSPSSPIPPRQCSALGKRVSAPCEYVSFSPNCWKQHLSCKLNCPRFSPDACSNRLGNADTVIGTYTEFVCQPLGFYFKSPCLQYY